MELIPVFPTVIFREEIKNYKDFKEELIKYAYKERSLDPQGEEKSNLGGWHSKSKYASFENPISLVVNKLIIEMLRNKDHFNIKNFNIDSMWININQPGNSNTKHIHGGSDLSGVFWIKQPQNGGRIALESPHVFSQYRQLISYNPEIAQKLSAAQRIDFEPVEGAILIFPSDLYHWVTINVSNEERISVSFNINLKL